MAASGGLKSRQRVLQQGQEGAAAAAAPEGRLFMLKVIALVIAAVILQTTMAPYLMVLGTKPDVTLVVVVCLALMRGPIWGAVTGFATGILIDVALVQMMGISSFLLTLGGYFSGSFSERIDPESWMPPVLAVFAVTLVLQALNAVIMFLLGVEASVWFIILRIILPSAVLNALIAAPVFAICRWWLGADQTNVFSIKE
ncbi:MAG: rod shape-determining protein MreD [Actinobacteria bacterium]|nr:rod shape-determining protein MreD [Actinomycetota bacterium]